MVTQLREAITGSGRTLVQIASSSGIAPSQLSRFVRGERSLTLDAVEKVCRVLHLRLAPEPAALPPPDAP